MGGGNEKVDKSEYDNKVHELAREREKQEYLRQLKEEQWNRKEGLQKKYKNSVRKCYNSN